MIELILIRVCLFALEYIEIHGRMASLVRVSAPKGLYLGSPLGVFDMRRGIHEV